MDIDRVKDGVFVSGGGDFSVRSYVDKAGIKKHSNEVRVSAFGLDTAYVGREQAEPAPVLRAQKSVVPAKVDDSEPPW